MKTALLLSAAVLCLFITSTSFSQYTRSNYTKAGQLEFGGDLSFTSTTYTYYTGTLGNEAGYGTTVRNFSIDANGGYFVIKGLKLGIETGVELTDVERTQTTLKLYFAPEYVISTGSDVYPFAGISAGYTSINPYYEQSANGFSWGVKGGVKVNLAGNSLLNIAIRYYEEQYKTHYEYAGYQYIYNDIKDKIKQLGLSAGWSLFF